MFEQLSTGNVVQGNKGRYEVMNVVGRGGMGVVYRVRRSHDGTTWALKEQRPDTPQTPTEAADNRRLFEQEAQLILRLQHPNIVGGEELFSWQERLYLVMEYVSGETLEKRLRDANAPSFEQDALRWAIQMARVFAYLHGQQPPIIYRDLKPANVMLLPDGTLKFIDFGVARTHKQGKSKDTVAIGTLGYAPPEQYGKGQTDARSDIYTLGATLYHLLTNVPPRPLHTPKAGEIVAFNPSVQARTEQIVIRAMQQNRDHRFQSAVEMEQEMQACMASPLPDAGAVVAAPVAQQPQVPSTTVTRRAPPPSPTTPNVPPVQRAPKQPPIARPTAAPPAVTPPATDGTHAVPNFCPSCGFGNKSTARFCVNCGTTLPAQAPSVSREHRAKEHLRDARLVVRTPRRSWTHALRVLPCRIGRRDPSQGHYPELDLAEDDSGHASRRHAVIDRRNGQFTLTDMGSVNGTVLNGVKITANRPQPLRIGDRIRIGDVELRLEEQP